MNEETLNLSIRKFLKMVGISSQREIEHAVAKAITERTIAGNEAFPAHVTLVVAKPFSRRFCPKRSTLGSTATSVCSSPL